MDGDTKGLGLLAPVPAKAGECTRRVMHDPPFEDWVEVRVVLDGAAGVRVVTAMFDENDLPGSVSDLVTIDGGRRQEAVSARVDTDGVIHGTYSITENDRHAPRPLTEEEIRRLREVAAALKERYTPPRPRS